MANFFNNSINLIFALIYLFQFKQNKFFPKKYVQLHIGFYDHTKL